MGSTPGGNQPKASTAPTVDIKQVTYLRTALGNYKRANYRTFDFVPASQTQKPSTAEEAFVNRFTASNHWYLVGNDGAVVIVPDGWVQEYGFGTVK